MVAMKTNIEMQMKMVPMAMTYASALVNDINTVNQKSLYKAINNTRKRQRVQHTNTGCGGRVRSEVGVRGGRGVRWGRGWSGRDGSRRNDECQVIGIDGTTIKVYAEYLFDHERWFNIPETVRNQIPQMRCEYQTNKRQRTSGSMYNQISQVTRAILPLPPFTDVHVPPTITPPTRPQHQ